MIKIVFIAFIGVFISTMLKKMNSNFSVGISIISGVIIIGILYTPLKEITDVFSFFGNEYGIAQEHIKLLLKIIGISYITQFGASVAEECGEKFIAGKIELAGKVLLLSCSMPVFINLIKSILDLL